MNEEELYGQDAHLRALKRRLKQRRRIARLGIPPILPTTEESELIDICASHDLMDASWEHFFVEFVRSSEFEDLFERYPEQQIFAQILKTFLRRMGVEHWRLNQ
jgi:hypothetical protein